MSDDHGQPNTGGEETIRFLSAEWVAASDAALATAPPLPAPVSVGFEVSDGDDIVGAYRLILGPDRVGLEDDLDGANVVMSVDRQVAVAINQGQTSAQRAVLDGRLTVRGDAGVLLGHQAALAAIDDRLRDIRLRTVYD